jgi:RNA polymerase sigma factor (sigma-70 family)
MMLASKQLADFEGLVFATAARYAPMLDDDIEDIQQLLRIKVWQALDAFDPSRTSVPLENFVFSCLRNRMKDMFKAQDRRNQKRGGHQLYIEDQRSGMRDDDAALDHFHMRYLCADSDEVYFTVEDEAAPLPSTLNELEQQVVALLLLDFSQTEIARQLEVTRERVRSAHSAVKEKMADWHPGHAVPQVAAAQVARAA